MGLDMYLKESVFCGVNLRNKNTSEIKKLLNKQDCKGGVTVEVTQIYWRKANHIHRWFVENVQGGNDDCESYPVLIYDLEKLLAVCKAAKNDPQNADKILPTLEGPFFGATDLDEYYWEEVDRTIAELERVIDCAREYPEDFGSLSYDSSW